MQTSLSLMRMVALALLLYSLALFTTSLRDVASAEAAVAALERELAQAQQENCVLAEKREAAESGEGLEQLARERLGLVMPGEKIFYFITERDAAGSQPEADGEGA